MALAKKVASLWNPFDAFIYFGTKLVASGLPSEFPKNYCDYLTWMYFGNQITLSRKWGIDITYIQTVSPFNEIQCSILCDSALSHEVGKDISRGRTEPLQDASEILVQIIFA